MNLYDKASLIITPNAYKVGKIYAAKPTSGAGDLTVTRAGAGSRRNSAGVFESLANNVPPLNYPSGGCTHWCFQAQRTNLFLNPEAAATQNITVVIGQVYTVTTFGTVTATCSGAGAGVASNGTSFTFTASTTTLTVTISGLSGQAYVNCGLGAWAWQTPIMSGATSTTRPSDVIPIQTNALLFGASGEFTCKIRVIDNIAFTNPGTHLNGLYIRSAGGNGIYLAQSSGSRLRLWTGGAAVIYSTTANAVTLVITSNSSVLNVWANGVKVTTNFAYSIPANSYGANEPNAYINMEAFEIYPSVLTDSECVALSNT